MKQLGLLNFDAAPFAKQSVTMAPSAIEARRSGRQRVVGSVNARMARYKALLLIVGPMTDHQAADRLRLPLASVNAARGDWGLYAAHCGMASLAPVAIERVRKDWGSGHPTTRVRWGFR